MRTILTVAFILAAVMCQAQVVYITTDALVPFDKHWQDKHRWDLNVIDSATGIACPECGEELHATYTQALTSNPIQYHAWCPVCGWKGYI